MFVHNRKLMLTAAVAGVLALCGGRTRAAEPPGIVRIHDARAIGQDDSLFQPAVPRAQEAVVPVNNYLYHHNGMNAGSYGCTDGNCSSGGCASGNCSAGWSGEMSECTSCGGSCSSCDGGCGFSDCGGHTSLWGRISSRMGLSRFRTCKCGCGMRGCNCSGNGSGWRDAVDGYLGNGGCGVLGAHHSPDHGWGRPLKRPIVRQPVVYNRYWPAQWYGTPGAWGGPAQFPMVYMPTDTTQLGFYYQRVPTWQPNPAMIPPPPWPANWHYRECQGWNGQYAQPVIYESTGEPTPATTEEPTPAEEPAPQPEVAPLAPEAQNNGSVGSYR